MPTEAIFRDIVIDAIGGGWGQEEPFAGSMPVRVVRGTDFANLNSGQLDAVPLRYETSKKVARRVLRPGDILLEISGGSPSRGQSTGRTIYVTDDMLEQLGGEVIPASFCRRITVDSELCVPRYAYFALQDMYKSGRASHYEHQSTGISNFQFQYFLDAERIWLPSLDEQTRVVEVLGALDDKIELNRRMSETLHQIAESTFKDMFLPSAIGASEISEVAESTIGDEIDVTMGQSPPGSTYNTEGQGLPFYQGRTDFGMLFPTRRVYCTAPTRLAREGDTLLSVRAPVGDVNVAVEDCAIGRGVAALRHRSGSRVFTYFLARSLHATFDQFNGEGTVFGSISKKALLGLACPKPSDSQLHAFEKIGGPILLRLRSAMQESDTLISIRDALLPKLISGELRVPQAEQLVSEVV